MRRNSLHFLSSDRDLELASSNSNFNQARQQRLSSIISSDEYEEQEEDIIPNGNGKNRYRVSHIEICDCIDGSEM